MSGYLWALQTIVMPIILAVALIYATYETWQYRKRVRRPPERTHDGIWDEPAADPAGADRHKRRIIIWSVVAFVALVPIVIWAVGRT